MWDSNAPLQLLQTMPRKLTAENLEKIQLVIDADKYKNSLVSGFDLCGMYAPFCRGCRKTSIFPCAIAYVNMMQSAGLDVEIDARPMAHETQPEAGYVPPAEPQYAAPDPQYVAPEQHFAGAEQRFANGEPAHSAQSETAYASAQQPVSNPVNDNPAVAQNVHKPAYGETEIAATRAEMAEPEEMIQPVIKSARFSQPEVGAKHKIRIAIARKKM